ncbi:MAG: DUF4363 family protein [Clostridiaceae bacterium]
MKNIIFTILLFFAMIYGLHYANSFLDSISHELNTVDSEIRNQVQMSDWEKASEYANTLVEKWDKYEDKVSIFVNHNDVDTITNEVTKLIEYLSCKDTNESYASIATIDAQLKKIHKLEKITLENIF